MRPRKLYIKFEIVINFIVKIDSFLPRNLNKALLVFFRGTKGVVGIGIRYVLIKNLAKKCGKNVAVLESVIFDAVEMMEFGNNVSINSFCYLAGEIKIGNDVAIANHTSIHSVNHTYEDKMIAIKYQQVKNNPISIDNDVWIGSGCRILSGVHIASRVVIGAGSVVTKNVSCGSLIGGVPAKLIKNI